MANLVYEPDAAIEAANLKGKLIIRGLPQNQCRYIVLIDHDLRVQTVAIRGTANKENAWVDADTIKLLDPTLRINIHRGFQRATDELYTDIIPFLQKDYKTRITGHSLGGAMACVLMMRLMHDGYRVAQVVTFGQPKVTNDEGGQQYAAAPYLRVIDDEDIVPRIPPSDVVFDWSGPYNHFGPEIVLSTGTTFTYSPVPQPQPLASNDSWKNLTAKSLQDHQMKNYLDRLRGLR